MTLTSAGPAQPGRERGDAIGAGVVVEALDSARHLDGSRLALVLPAKPGVRSGVRRGHRQRISQAPSGASSTFFHHQDGGEGQGMGSDRLRHRPAAQRSGRGPEREAQRGAPCSISFLPVAAVNRQQTSEPQPARPGGGSGEDHLAEPTDGPGSWCRVSRGGLPRGARRAVTAPEAVATFLEGSRDRSTSRSSAWSLRRRLTGGETTVRLKAADPGWLIVFSSGCTAGVLDPELLRQARLCAAWPNPPRRRAPRRHRALLGGHR